MTFSSGIMSKKYYTQEELEYILNTTGVLPDSDDDNEEYVDDVLEFEEIDDSDTDMDYVLSNSENEFSDDGDLELIGMGKYGQCISSTPRKGRRGSICSATDPSWLDNVAPTLVPSSPAPGPSHTSSPPPPSPPHVVSPVAPPPARRERRRCRDEDSSASVPHPKKSRHGRVSSATDPPRSRNVVPTFRPSSPVPCPSHAASPHVVSPVAPRPTPRERRRRHDKDAATIVDFGVSTLTSKSGFR